MWSPARAATSSSCSSREPPPRRLRRRPPRPWPRTCAAALAKPFALANTDLYVTPSIGASLFPADGDTAETLLKHADIAMYAAKDGGRDGYRLYQPPKRDSSMELAIASQLRLAERRDELELYYQPIVDLDPVVHRRRRGADPVEPSRGRPAPARRVPVGRRAHRPDPADHRTGCSSGPASRRGAGATRTSTCTPRSTCRRRTGSASAIRRVIADRRVVRPEPRPDHDRAHRAGGDDRHQPISSRC